MLFGDSEDVGFCYFFDVLLCFEEEVLGVSEDLYKQLSQQGFDVLLDDRDVRAGIKFNDADLLGTPLRVTLGMRGIKEGKIEVKLRSEDETLNIPIQDAAAKIGQKIRELYDSIK